MALRHSQWLAATNGALLALEEEKPGSGMHDLTRGSGLATHPFGGRKPQWQTCSS
jgi:hypothetical protein